MRRRGFSLVEVILAVALFAIIASGAVVGLIGALDANRLSGEMAVALAYVSEGGEAMRSIRNRAFSNLVNTMSMGIARSAGNVWEYSGVNNVFDSRYTRTIAVSEAQRNAAGDIVANGGTPDPKTKRIESKVAWDFTAARPQDITQVTYLTDWRAPIVTGPAPMMAYSKTTSTPFYRTWDGAAWSAEGQAQSVGGNINFMVVKISRTRNEAVLGTLDANGNIYAQVWNGSSWGTPTLMANVTSANATTRSFDISYEKSGDRAMLAYLPSSTSADFAYRVWDGVSWSSPVTVTAPPTTGVIKSIDMKQNPISTSNEIALVMIDANIDVYGMVWTGSTWSNMGVSSAWDTTASIATKKAVDVAYEQLSGRAMFMWGDATGTDQYYRIWNGTSLTGPTLLDIGAAGGVVQWMELESRPDSNELLYAAVDAGSDLNTRKWSGSGWDTATGHPEHDGAVENITSMNFDVIWETHTANPGKAWLLWGDGATVSKKLWSGTAWGSASVLAGSDDTSFIRLKADPDTGAVWAGIYESRASATDDIWESHLTGGGTSWSGESTLWGGPISAEPVYFRIDMATR